MDTAQWPQEFGSVMKPMEELASSNNTSNSNGITRTLRPPQKQQQGPLQCPRCKSSNTKFCYYNNYSLTQPRYFCKACRRYWTEGGSLRNVPVGGGSRKNKERSPSTSISATSTQNPKFHEGGQDLNLAFPFNHFAHHMDKPNNSSSNCTSTSTTAMELLTNPFVPQMQSMPMMPEYSSGFGSVQQGYRPNTLIPSDGGYAIRMQGVQESSTVGGRLMFPFENSSDQFTDDEQNRRQEEGDAHGFWNGMI